MKINISTSKGKIRNIETDLPFDDINPTRLKEVAKAYFETDEVYIDGFAIAPVKTKILLIGQAPNLKPQDLPYDSTMLYDWFSEVNVCKRYAQHLFDFEAMTDKPPVIGKSGNHKAPTKKEQRRYFSEVLEDKIENSNVVILLGYVPMRFFKYETMYQCINNNGKLFITMLHPSARNIDRYRKNKERILELLTKAINYNERIVLNGKMDDLHIGAEKEDDTLF